MAESQEKISDEKEDDDVINKVLEEVRKFVGTNTVELGRKEYNDIKQRYHQVTNHKSTTDDWNTMKEDDKMAVLSLVSSDFRTIAEIMQRARSYGIHKSTSASLTVARYLHFLQDKTSTTNNADKTPKMSNSLTSPSIHLPPNNTFKSRKPPAHAEDDVSDETIRRLSPVLGENLNDELRVPLNGRTSTPAERILQNDIRSRNRDNSAICDTKPFALKEQIRLLTEQNKELANKNSQQKHTIEELQYRITENSNSVMTADDKNAITPPHVARIMDEVKAKEWKEAYNVMMEECTPILAMEKLTSMIDRIYAFCQEVSITQLIKLEHHMTKCVLTASATYTGKEVTEEAREDIHLSTVTTKTAKEYRKSVATACVPAVQRLYQDNREHSLQTTRETNNLNLTIKMEPYINKCVEFCWYICIQDPPMKVRFSRQGEKIDKEMFSVYEKDGDVTRVCVWPALLLSEKGTTCTIKRGLVLPV